MVHLTVFCSHVSLHVGLGKWFLADRTHTNVPLTVDLMDGKIIHRNFLFATEIDTRKRRALLTDLLSCYHMEICPVQTLVSIIPLVNISTINSCMLLPLVFKN